MVNNFLMYKTALYEHVYVMCVYIMKTDIYIYIFALTYPCLSGREREERKRAGGEMLPPQRIRGSDNSYLHSLSLATDCNFIS